MAEARTGATVALDGHPHHDVDAPDRAPLLRRPAPVAAIASGFAAVAFVTSFPGPEAVVSAFFAAVLVVLAATDLERRIIPNRIVLPATAIVFAANVAISPGRSLDFALAGLVLAIAFAIPALINPSLMGMGDVKLMMLLGAGLGWRAVDAVIIACVAMFPFAVATLVRGGAAARKTGLPFGPFLALGGLIVLLVIHLGGVG
jgi:leader peptidase (prepilin peptidase)/N-methyltransferase